MTRRRLLAHLGVVAAALLVALGAANAAYRADASGEANSHHAVVGQHAGARDVGLHVGTVKTPRPERLVGFGLAILAAGLVAVVLRRRGLVPSPVLGGRLGFAAGALGRGPPVLPVR